jgi:hypothetical protein
MTLRIEPLFDDDIDPLLEAGIAPEPEGPGALLGDPAHIEDRLLADFDAFLAGRGVLPALRRRGCALLLEALEQVGDAESGWERLSLTACVAAVVGDRPSPFIARLWSQLAQELVAWLGRSGRLSASARRRLLHGLPPRPIRPAQASAARLAA